jgi:2-polyprenyl-3-methyl-5-hydroxy-6-metoxy-1,4-benzoquinol methylase
MSPAPLFIIGVLLAILGVAFLVAAGWRLATHRVSIPCPPWLAWLLERPLTSNLRLDNLLDRLDLQPGMQVLDAGCGPGRLTVPIAQRVGAAGHVTAVDIQAGMLSRAQARVAAAGLENVTLVQAGLGRGALQHSRYDRALLVTVLGEIPDRQSALREIFQALKPGGMLSVSEVVYDPHFQPPRGLRRLSAAIGFREIAFHGNRFAFTLNLQKPSRARG